MGTKHDNNDDEPEYGAWEFTAESVLEEERRLFPAKQPEDIWPQWNEGVPSKFRRTLYAPPFTTKSGVRHEGRPRCDTLELRWNGPCTLAELCRSYHLLPSNSAKSYWSGVYRIFLPDTTIDRLCGKDSTGTLYLGLAGTGARGWSILRNRLMAVAKGEHHAMRQWDRNNAIRQKFPDASLMVEWAYTGMRPNYTGELIHEATMAENMLLLCYRDSYGEFPPLNEKA